ncbi:MAG: serine protease [Methylobacter sp.]|nr:serine protease [Methylobacter sp.]
MKNIYTKKIALTLATTLLLSANAMSGEKQTRIVNGAQSDAEQYPWFVSILSDDEPSCGGSLIHPRYVLTAAHCFEEGQDASTVKVVIGRQKLSETSTGQAIVATALIRHPDYDSTSNDNDIALVELSEAANAQVVKLAAPVHELTSGIVARSVGRGGLAAPADYLADKYALEVPCSEDLEGCLDEAVQAGISEDDIVGSLLLANGLDDERKGIGYRELLAQSLLGNAVQPTLAQLAAAYKANGKGLVDMADIIINAAGGSDELRQVDLPLIDNVTCSDSTGDTLTDNMFCAGYSGTPKDTCQGDSGGPLFMRNNRGNDWLQIGIVSYGATCATNYGVYAKVANYLDWIEQQVPEIAYERLFAWGEATVTSLLQPVGTERSIELSPYYARFYSASGTAVGYNAEDQQLYFYDGANLSPLGPISEWVGQAKAAGY